MNSDYIHVPEGVLQWATKHNRIRTYKSQETIYRQGDYAHQFYCLIQGKVQVFVTSDNGAEKTLTVYHRQALLGEAAFFDGFARTTSARALDNSQIAIIDRESILACFQEEPGLALSMLTSLSRTVRMLSTQINQISFLPADKRLAKFLLDEVHSGHEQIPYTHEEIGSLIGSSRVTVSRTLRYFKEQRWIETGYRSLTIQNPEALELFLDS